MMFDDLAQVLHVIFVHLRIAGFLQDHVVADSAANERFFDIGMLANFFIQVEHRFVVDVQVFTNIGENARWPFAFPANLFVDAFHFVHVGRRPAQIGNVPFKIGHQYQLIDFFQDRFFRSAGDKFSLMGRNGAECAASKAAPVDVHRMADHVVGRNLLFIFVTRMGQPGVRKIVKTVDFLLFERWPGRIYNYLPIANFLNKHIGFHLVRFFLDVHEVFGIFLFILQAFFVGIKSDAVPFLVGYKIFFI